jgi:hypothetical protein
MMNKILSILLLLVLLPFARPATAESLMFDYFTMLSPRDTYNSKGAPLSDFCTVVQQDRANVHKFGNPDGDPPDPFFTTVKRRGMIAGKCDYVRTYHTVNRVRRQMIGFVWVRVYGVGNRVTRVLITEAAG